MEEEEVMALSSAGTLGQVCSLQIKLVRAIISLLLENKVSESRCIPFKKNVFALNIFGNNNIEKGILIFPSLLGHCTRCHREKYEPVVLGQDALSDDEGQKTPHGNALVAPTIKPTIRPKLEVRA